MKSNETYIGVLIGFLWIRADLIPDPHPWELHKENAL